MTAHRQTIAVLALAGLFVAAYLWLHRIGVVGTLSCGASGGCDTVQISRYAVMLGIPVPAYGLGGYATLLAVSLAGLHPRWRGAPGVTPVLAGLATVGFAYTAYLSYLEVFVIRAMCRWCVASALIMTAIWVVALLELRGVGRRA